jgi:hypothetical protein
MGNILISPSDVLLDIISPILNQSRPEKIAFHDQHWNEREST